MTSQDAVAESDWQRALKAIATEWTQVRRAHEEISVAAWDAALSAMRSQQQRLVGDGLWVSGPSDLLTIVGRHHDELVHSNVVAWLLTPTGRHGLGTRVLKMLFETEWPGAQVPKCDLVVIEREVTLGRRRADVIAHVDETILVLENKVGAMESPDQCEDLYTLWMPKAEDVRFLLLSATGRPPVSIQSPEATVAWRSMSYPAFRGLVAVALEAASVDASARPAVAEYLATLDRLYPRDHLRLITSGGGDVKQ